jgi:hypothetical protein
MVGRPRHFGGAECPQMIRDELRIQEAVVPGPQTRDQMHEGDFGSVAFAVEHALAEKCASETDAVEAAHQHVVLVHLDSVTIAALIELAIQIVNARVDPGPRTPRCRVRAAANDGVKVAIDDNGEAVGADGAR